MTSRRLPGKVLRPLNGRPTLAYIAERLERCRQLDGHIVATSVEPSDDPIAAWCEQNGVTCHRGPLDDVAARFVETARAHALDAFARLTADSPLLDQQVVDRAVELFRSGDFDLVTNVFPSTFPSGQSVEVVKAVTYETIYPELSDPYEHEHVTPFFYRHPERFRIENFTRAENEGALDISLDTEQDAELIERLLAAMERPHWEYGTREIVALLRTLEASP